MRSSARSLLLAVAILGIPTETVAQSEFIGFPGTCAGAGRNRDPRCPTFGERRSDQVESEFWREREDGPPTPAFRGHSWLTMPSPFPPTAEGPLTIGDLRLRSTSDGGYVGERPAYGIYIAPDGRVEFRDRKITEKRGAFGLIGATFSFNFDLTELLMRGRRKDPYFHDKGLVMALTRGERWRMSEDTHRRRVDDALATLPRDLATLWTDRRLPVAERRLMLFRLWDEMAEPKEAAPEETAAAQGRKMIESFIRTRLPRGSADAYDPGELERLNRTRLSRARFAPYGD